MKPTKMRNRMIYRATFGTRNKQLASPLSKQLRLRYGKRSSRVMEGDTVVVIKGEYKGIEGKVNKVSTAQNKIAVDGITQEKAKGEKFDVYIRTSNVVITGLNEDDNFRMSKLRKSHADSAAAPALESESDTMADQDTAAEDRPYDTKDTLDLDSTADDMDDDDVVGEPDEMDRQVKEFEDRMHDSNDEMDRQSNDASADRTEGTGMDSNDAHAELQEDDDAEHDDAEQDDMFGYPSEPRTERHDENPSDAHTDKGAGQAKTEDEK